MSLDSTDDLSALVNRLTVILSWASNHAHVKVWIDYTEPFSKLTGLVAGRWSVEMDK